MKLTIMFESSSETSVVKCSQDGEKPDQSGALLVPADSCDLSSSKSKLKDDRSSPVLNMLNGDSDVQADLKKTLEPLSLNNGDGASSDDLERISCRTPVGDNDSSSEKENYLFDDGGSEESLKLRITESEDEGEMSPRATSPFEDVDQDCSEQALPQTEDHDGTNGESKDNEQNCDNEQQENKATEPDVSSPIVTDQDSEISGKLLRSEEECGPDTTCVQEKDCNNTHAEFPGSDDCHSAELVEPEKSELCCDIASDSDTVKCSCDGVCSSTCTYSVSKQEIGSKLKTHAESNISLELDKCTAEHPVTCSGEQSGSLNNSDSLISVKECSSNSETSFPEDCSSNTVSPVSEPTVSESEVTTKIAQNSSVGKENISEESVTDPKTTGDLAVTNTVGDEPSSVEKIVCSVSGENDNSVTGVVAIRATTVSDSFNGGGNNGEDGDLTYKDQDCRSSVVEPVDTTRTLEILSAESADVNGLSTADEDDNYRENVSSVSKNDVKLDSGVSVSEVTVKFNGEESVGMKESETVLPLTENKLAASQNSVTVTSSVTFSGEESDCMKESETVLPLAETKLAAAQNSVTITSPVTFPGEESETVLPLAENKLAAAQNSVTTTSSVTFPVEESDGMKESETVLPLAESKVAASQNSVTRTDSTTVPGEGSDNMKDSETVLSLAESKLSDSENSTTVTNSVTVPGGRSDGMKDSETVSPLSESKLSDSENSTTVTNSVAVPGGGSDGMKDSETVLPFTESKLSTSQNSCTTTNSVTVSDDSAFSHTSVSQENSELTENNLEAVSKSVPEDKQSDAEMLSAVSQSNIDKKISDTHGDGKEVLRNCPVDDSIGAVIKGNVLLTQECCSSKCDKMADNNENLLMINQISVPGTGENELEMKGSKSSVHVDVNVKNSETNEVTGDGLKVDEGSVGKERDVDSNNELVSVTNMSELESKTMDDVKDCETSRAPESEMESHVRSPETVVGGSNTEKIADDQLDSSIATRTSGDTIVGSANCENEEPLTLSDVANALKDAVDTVTLQDGESISFTGCEASVPPLSSEVHNLPPSDMLISDNTSALVVDVADQEVRPENVQEAPGITEAVRRRRKRSIEDVMPDRISKRTRGSMLASSSGANSPEKLAQTSAESAKRSVVDSSVEEDAKRVRLNEEYDKVVKRIEQTVAPNGVVTGEIGSRRIFLEKIRAKDLKNLTVAELEEFFVEKICEALAYRHELGIMRQKQQAVENQMELWRKKTLTMCKQVRDMELVMKRYQNDLKTRKDRPVIPVKVTRSVGLQVHDVSSDPSSRALLHKRKRMEQQVSSVSTVQRPSPQSPLASNISTVPTSQSASVSTRGTTSSPQYSRTATSTNSQTNVPAAGSRVPSKPNSGLKTLMPRQQSVSVNTNASTTSPTTANSSRVQQMTRSKVASTAGSSPVGTPNKSSRQVIDLTDDGDRGRSAQPRTTAVMTSVNTNTVPANNSVGAPTTLTPTSSIRILPQPVTATAVAAGANILATGVTTNSSVPRLTYLVPTSNQLQQRPVLLASSPSQGVPNAVVTVTGGQKNQAPAVYVKNGAVVSVSPLVGSGAVGQQVQTSARPSGLQPSVAQGSPNRPQIRPAQVITGSPQSRSLPQHAQHPAPLPVALNLNLNNPDLKKMPPRPELKISKQSRHQGIVLSWNMPVTNEYAAIASYQLYAYQESSSPPSTAHWKKVGDVKALPLPMACTLTQFVEGHKYHFAVRAVDIHSRVGPFSLPGSIVLTRK